MFSPEFTSTLKIKSTQFHFFLFDIHGFVRFTLALRSFWIGAYEPAVELSWGRDVNGKTHKKWKQWEDITSESSESSLEIDILLGCLFVFLSSNHFGMADSFFSFERVLLDLLRGQDHFRSICTSGLLVSFLEAYGRYGSSCCWTHLTAFVLQSEHAEVELFRVLWPCLEFSFLILGPWTNWISQLKYGKDVPLT